MGWSKVEVSRRAKEHRNSLAGVQLQTVVFSPGVEGECVEEEFTDKCGEAFRCGVSLEVDVKIVAKNFCGWSI